MLISIQFFNVRCCHRSLRSPPLSLVRLFATTWSGWNGDGSICWSRGRRVGDAEAGHLLLWRVVLQSLSSIRPQKWTLHNRLIRIYYHLRKKIKTISKNKTQHKSRIVFYFSLHSVSYNKVNQTGSRWERRVAVVLIVGGFKWPVGRWWDGGAGGTIGCTTKCQTTICQDSLVKR